MKKETFRLIAILLFILIMGLLSSCHKNDDFDLKSGTYKVFSPISVDGVLLNKEFWVITDDSLIIIRDGNRIYANRIVWHGRRVDLFPFGYNPYYDDDMSMGIISTVYWGFFYAGVGVPTFTLQREP